MARFRNRHEAGRLLAAQLQTYADEHPLILALPRGGVPVGYEVAQALHADLDIWVVRKVGVPWRPELGVGAVAEGGYLYLNHDIMENVQITEADLIETIEAERRQVLARVAKFRGKQPPPVLADRTVIVVDDGIATGGTVRAALRSIREAKPACIVLAVPVAAADIASSLVLETDRFISLRTPRDLYAIGLWYEDFEQVPDEEVVRLLARSHTEAAPAVAHLH